MSDGILITFEGIEGSGKTHHAGRLVEYLNRSGRKAILTHEPGGTSVGSKIREIFLNPYLELHPRTELFLVLADRAQHVAEKLKPALARGEIVVSDRYVDSTTAYQGYGRGFYFSENVLETLNNLAGEGLVPDLTILLDCPVELGLARARNRTGDEGGELDRFELETVEFHARVREGFLTIASRCADRIKVIKSDAPPDVVHREIVTLVEDFLRTRCR